MSTSHVLAAEAPARGGRALAALQIAVFAAAAAALTVPLSADQVVGAGWGPKLALLGRMLLLVILAHVMLRARGRRWTDVGLSRPKRWWTVPVAVVLGYLACGAMAAGLHAVVLPQLGLEAPDLGRFAALKGDLYEYLFWAVPVAWGSAAFGEELAARGFLNDAFAALIGGREPGRLAVVLAVVLQALLFGACHAYQGLGGAVLTAGVGLVLGFVWLFTGRNLWAAIVLHGLVDFVSLSAFYFGAVS